MTRTPLCLACVDDVILRTAFPLKLNSSCWAFLMSLQSVKHRIGVYARQVPVCIHVSSVPGPSYGDSMRVGMQISEPANGETIYLYGLGRLAQMEGSGSASLAEWFPGDALGSVRQVVDDAGDVLLSRDDTPYGGRCLPRTGRGAAGTDSQGKSSMRG